MCIKEGKQNPKQQDVAFKGVCCGGTRGPGDGKATICKKRRPPLATGFTICNQCHREIKWWLSESVRRELEEEGLERMDILGLNESAKELIEEETTAKKQKQ